MYAPFFGLKQAPFSIAPDPRYLYMSERHREALAHLLYGLEGGGGFVLLTGEIGAGKTTVCRCFLEQLPPHCHVAYIFNPKLSVAELLRSVCDEFHIPLPAAAATVKDFVDPLNAFLLAAHAAGRSCVLVIDEAQNLSADVLEQLRLLTNLETAERKLLQIILIGQPELRELLARPELEQLAQRVIARFHLSALSEAETADYVRHRLAVAGLAGAAPFTPAALRRVHQLARGVPRRINLLCDRAMLGAYAGAQAEISPAIVDRAAAEVFASPGLGGSTGGLHTLRWGAALAASALLGAGLLWLAQQRAPEPGRGASAVVVASTAAGGSSSPLPPFALAKAPSAPASTNPSSQPPALPAQPIALHHLAELPNDEHGAWQALAAHWGWAPPASEPCAAAAHQGLGCYRSTHASLALVRQLDRPVLLALHPAAQPAGAAPLWAVLIGLDMQTAYFEAPGAGLPSSPSKPWAIALPELASAWRGELITLWRLPPGAAGGQDPARLRRWLSEQLATLTAASPQAARPASAEPAPAEVARQLQIFQAGQGLQPDGLAGPITLMQLNRALHLPEPHLLAQPALSH